MADILGLSEALILTALALGDELSVAQIAERLEIYRDIAEGSIYMALRRMAERGFVAASKRQVKSVDDRMRTVGFFKITGAGRKVLSEFDEQLEALPKLRAATGLTGSTLRPAGGLA